MPAGFDGPDWGLVELAGESLNTWAWWCTDSYRLLDPAPRRRTNKLIPGVAGRRGRRSVPDSRSVKLTVPIIGEYDRLGAANDDPEAGLEESIDYLVVNVYNAAEDAAGSIAVRTQRKDGIWLAGRVQLDDCTTERKRTSATMTFEVTLLDGELTVEDGS